MPAAIVKMNGKSFTHFTFTDFGQPGRRERVGRHTGEAEAFRSFHRWKRVYARAMGGTTSAGAPRIADFWVEDSQGQRLEPPSPSRVAIRKSNIEGRRVSKQP